MAKVVQLSGVHGQNRAIPNHAQIILEARLELFFFLMKWGEGGDQLQIVSLNRNMLLCNIPAMLSMPICTTKLPLQEQFYCLVIELSPAKKKSEILSWRTVLPLLS